MLKIKQTRDDYIIYKIIDADVNSPTEYGKFVKIKMNYTVCTVPKEYIVDIISLLQTQITDTT